MNLNFSKMKILPKKFICELEVEEFYVDFTIIELTSSDMMMDDMVVEDSKIDDFSKVSNDNIREASQEDRQFISKVHRYEGEWDSWEPETILAILKNGAIKMMEANN